MSKKQTILNHWGKHKPVQTDLDKLYTGELREGETEMKWVLEKIKSNNNLNIFRKVLGDVSIDADIDHVKKTSDAHADDFLAYR